MTRVLLALLFLCATAAATPEDAEVAALYARGLNGDKQAVEQCIARLEERLSVAPNDELARVYLGSAWTLRSRDLPFGPGKLSALRKGIALMDEAAAAAPENARVLLLRAVTNEAIPAILGRRTIARKELDQLMATVEKEPQRLSPSDRQLLYLNAGEAAMNAGEKERAQELWNRGLSITGDPALTAQIRKALAGR